jgi:uncharacterized protein involved in exopolysaccharide biosynthesis/Mrp family chromosome partitioning ATPase
VTSDGKREAISMAESDSIFPSDPRAGEGLPFTVRDVLRILFKHKILILTCFVVFTVVAGFGLMRIPVSYEAGAKVLVKVEQQVTPSFFSGIAATRESPLADPAGRRIETEMELLETTPLAEDVVKKLGLTYAQVYHKPYVHLLNPVTDALEPLLAVFGVPRDPEKYGFRSTVEEFKKSLIVKPIKSKSAEASSNIIDITLQSPSPDLAQKALDVLLASYTSFDITLNQQAGEKAHSIVKLQLDETQAKVLQAQDRLRAFLLQKGSSKGSRGGGAASLASNAGTGSRTAADARVDAGDGLVTSPGDHTSISLLKTRLIELEMEKLDTQKTFQGDSDRAQVLGRTISALQQRLSKEIKSDAENDVALATLERDVRTIETEHLEINKKLAQIDLFLKMNQQQPPNRIVVEPPVRPRSSDMKRKVAVGLLSSVAGLLLGLALAGMREYGDTTLRSPRDVKSALGIEVLSQIPKVPAAALESALRREPPAPEGAADAARELSFLFNRLALRVLAALETRGPRDGAPLTLLVTSVGNGEGKTTIARAVASCIADQTDKRVLLADADFELPALREAFATGDVDTLNEALRSGAFPRRLARTRYNNLAVLPATAEADRSLLFRQKAVTAFLASARETFDIVIFDGARLATLGANSLPYLVDGILLVVDSETCRREVAESVVAPLEVPPARWIGAVLEKKVRYIPGLLYRRF